MKRVLIYISKYVFKDELAYINEHNRGASFYSSLNFNYKLLKGLESQYDSIFILSMAPVGSFPNHSDIIVCKDCSEKNLYCPRFVNIFGIRNLSAYFGLKKIFNRLIQKKINKDALVDIICVEATWPVLKTGVYIHKKIPNSILCFVVLDLPNQMNPLKSGFLYKFFKSVDNDRMKSLYPCINSFVFLSKQMKPYFSLSSGQNYIIMEGMANSPRFVSSQNKKNSKKRIVYTGTISREYVNYEMLFALAEKMYEDRFPVEIILAGSGEVKELVEETRKVPLLKYIGSLDSAATKKLQESADLLINLRFPDNDCKFGFPSKILEYLECGRPIVCYKLVSIPDEYDNVLFYPKGLTLTDLLSEIIICLNMTNFELDELQKKESILLKTKTPVESAKKIVKLMNHHREKE